MRERFTDKDYALAIENRKNLYLNIDAMTAIERKYGFRSSFYFLLDEYDITSLTETLSRLRSDGWEMGLHGGLRTSEDLSKMRDEIGLFANAFGTNPQGIREHYLKFDPKALAKRPITATFERSTVRRLDGMRLPGESRSRAMNRILRKYHKAVKAGKIVEGSAETKPTSQLNNDLAIWQIHDRVPASVEELTKIFGGNDSLGCEQMKCSKCGHDREKDLSDLSQLLASIRDLRAGLSDPQVPSETVENPGEPLQSQRWSEEELPSDNLEEVPSQ